MTANYEKIIISTPEEAKLYEAGTITEKHFIIKSSLWDTKFERLEHCIVEGGNVICQSTYKTKFLNTNKLYADELRFSIFENCKKIQVGDMDENYKVLTSQFANCSEINIIDAKVEDCIFIGIESMYLANSLLSDCIISDIVCKSDCAILLEDSKISDVTIGNVILKNGSYLIEGVGEPWIEMSIFRNIRTSREDKEIFHQEETKGKIFKKKKEYSFVDEESCAGLLFIADIEGNINLEKIEEDFRRNVYEC